MALRKFGLPPCLHIPVAARHEAAIGLYVGRIRCTLGRSSSPHAFLVEPYRPQPRNKALPIWELDGADILHAPRQVWVDVDYTRYRTAYIEAFPDEELTGLVVDHILNRRVARFKGFRFVRVVAISRAANSSSGGLSERWGADFHGKNEERTRRLHAGMQIQYADLADIVKMMNRKTGGALQDPVNEAQRWVTPR